jgi:hypothetical protein
MLEWLSTAGRPANCMVGASTRACARRLAHFALDPPDTLLHEANRLAGLHGPCGGRVQTAGTCTEPAVVGALRAAMPSELASALRPNFEWYSCRGAHFHNDAHYDGVLFGAWCLAGPAMDLVFPRVGRRVPSDIGTVVVFDPFEPHGVLWPGSERYVAERYLAVAPSVFLAFELALTVPVRAAFDIGAPLDGVLVLSSDRPVNAETGALA